MTDIVNHLAPTLFGFLQNQIMEERSPEDLLIRRQQILGPGRFTMLIRCMEMRSQHLCGYVLANPNTTFLAPEITYRGYGTRDIAWRWFNAKRRLAAPGKVTPDGELDYWVGFDFRNDPKLSEESAIRYLAAFELRVNGSDGVRG